MAEATLSLVLNRVGLNRPAALLTLAHLGAKKAVKEELKARGWNVQQVSYRELELAARAYLAQHCGELAEAAEKVRSYPPLLKLARQEHRERAQCCTNAAAL